MRYRTIGTDPRTRREVSVLALGAMLFGSLTDEKTSFAVLDRYAEAGGNFIDTSDNYAFWTDGGQGGQSEELLDAGGAAGESATRSSSRPNSGHGRWPPEPTTSTTPRGCPPR